MNNDIGKVRQEFALSESCDVSNADYVRTSGAYSVRLFGEKRLGGLLNPITTQGGFDNLFSYLNRLCSNEGSLFSYCRLHSKFSPATESIVDQYELRSLDGDIKMRVYIDIFHPVETACAPYGLRLRDVSELSDIEIHTLCEPVRQSVPFFSDEE